VKAWQAGVTPQYRTVKSIDPTMNLLVWDTPLLAPLDFTKAISFESVEFSLTVHAGGQPREIFSGLSLDQRHPKYIQTAVTAATSQYIEARDLHSTSAWAARLPDPTALQLDNGTLQLWGGRDGIAALTARDFMGDPGSETKWGLRTLEDVDQVSLVCAADILIEPSPAVQYAPLPPVVSRSVPSGRAVFGGAHCHPSGRWKPARSSRWTMCSTCSRR